MQLRDRGWGRRHWLPLVYRKPRLLGNLGPTVTFTFDDFPRTAYTEGGSILKRLGARGTYYTSLALMNSVNSLGNQFRLEDLHSLVADGHELATHTLHHVSSHILSCDDFVAEVRSGREQIKHLSGLAVSDNFAYPHGKVTAATKRKVGKHMLSCRGTYHGVNGPVVDLNLLLANPLYGDIDQLSSARHLLQINEQRSGWVIFYTHDVRESPSPYGCTFELLESVVNMALERSMKVLTVNQVIAKLADRNI